MLFGSTLVFYSLSPYFGALGLVLVAVSGCLLCGLLGSSFVALVLVLIYMGGMLVVFVYSTAISAERYPVVSNLNEVFLLSGVGVVWVFASFDSFLSFSFGGWSMVVESDLVGGGVLYSVLGGYLLVGGFVLFVALVVALVITYGAEYNILKAL
uniref:NADH-ubiquinone oxidoreductase chain 6 n=1 Tax=Acanthaster planci TaxID=133434 RepID=A0A8D4XKU5_ACAPL|nr:NADH dehydrogenase subunit 6 [Acanthaster planci]BCH36372.1 NADH dehydrogenase subunit 6 [Acanthaster planci]BCH36438.1 NADH dehydrogenase subunit 6 [Acanthaster planci]BCH36449.1 NADH dehydrogenase subunit 6 [Acanthaster planci]BCH36460.1 NADH dehydrogenase subunit 6 [Acanthaster planci]